MIEIDGGQEKSLMDRLRDESASDAHAAARQVAA